MKRLNEEGAIFSYVALTVLVSTLMLLPLIINPLVSNFNNQKTLEYELKENMNNKSAHERILGMMNKSMYIADEEGVEYEFDDINKRIFIKETDNSFVEFQSEPFEKENNYTLSYEIPADKPVRLYVRALSFDKEFNNYIRVKVYDKHGNNYANKKIEVGQDVRGSSYRILDVGEVTKENEGLTKFVLEFGGRPTFEPEINLRFDLKTYSELEVKQSNIDDENISIVSNFYNKYSSENNSYVPYIKTK